MPRARWLEFTSLLFLLAAAPAPAPPAPPEVNRIPAAEAATILGRRALDQAGDQIGHIVDVLVDSSGRPVAALLDVGGYMGLGSRKIAIDWARLHFTIAGDDTHVTADINGDTIAATPEYKGGTTDKPVLTGPAPKQ